MLRLRERRFGKKPNGNSKAFIGHQLAARHFAFTLLLYQYASLEGRDFDQLYFTNKET